MLKLKTHYPEVPLEAVMRLIERQRAIDELRANRKVAKKAEGRVTDVQGRKGDR